MSKSSWAEADEDTFPDVAERTLAPSNDTQARDNYGSGGGYDRDGRDGSRDGGRDGGAYGRDHSGGGGGGYNGGRGYGPGGGGGRVGGDRREREYEQVPVPDAPPYKVSYD